MTALTHSPQVEAFLDKIAGVDSADANGAPRTKAILRKIIGDLFETIEQYDVSDDEFWTALNFLAAGAPEFGLWAAGLGFEHFLDLRLDAKDAEAGVAQGTPRTIEGPLYVGGAPLVESGSRIDDGSDDGEILIMHGQVRDLDGRPVADAVVDVWHANTKGNYSFFDKSQSDYNMRRRIKTDAQGRYEFRSIMPSGYAVPPGGSTDLLLQAVGRHGNRPAHIHFFVTAPGHRHLTTQINIDGDPFLHDDFAYATRDELIAQAVRRDQPAELQAKGLGEPYYEIDFDFVLTRAADETQTKATDRPHFAPA